jgi:hypothetical protein
MVELQRKIAKVTQNRAHANEHVWRREDLRDLYHARLTHGCLRKQCSRASGDG